MNYLCPICNNKLLFDNKLQLKIEQIKKNHKELFDKRLHRFLNNNYYISSSLQDIHNSIKHDLFNNLEQTVKISNCENCSKPNNNIFYSSLLKLDLFTYIFNDNNNNTARPFFKNLNFIKTTNPSYLETILNLQENFAIKYKIEKPYQNLLLNYHITENPEFIYFWEKFFNKIKKDIKNPTSFIVGYNIKLMSKISDMILYKIELPDTYESKLDNYQNIYNINCTVKNSFIVMDSLFFMMKLIENFTFIQDLPQNTNLEDSIHDKASEIIISVFQDIIKENKLKDKLSLNIAILDHFLLSNEYELFNNSILKLTVNLIDIRQNESDSIKEQRTHQNKTLENFNQSFTISKWALITSTFFGIVTLLLNFWTQFKNNQCEPNKMKNIVIQKEQFIPKISSHVLLEKNNNHQKKVKKNDKKTLKK